jgi:phosphatidylglycerol---prolipoprotein diacylglyceryl transferase
MTSAWVHNLSPFIIEFSEGFGIRWYGMAYLTGFILAYFFMDLMAKRGTILLTREQVADFITYVAIGTLAGGRIGYALFYAPELLWTFPQTTVFGFHVPMWGVLMVWKGGMASHGGMLGVVLACFLFARKHKIVFTHLVDLCCFGGGLGVFCGRIANFINGELYGRECPPDLWMAVKFPSEMFTWGASDLDKIRGLEPAAKALNIPLSMLNTNIDYVKEAIVLATQKHNAAVIAAIAPILTPRYPSQLIQAFLEGLLVVLILAWLWRKPHKPGFISGVFGFCYAIARIIGEQFRLPDHDIGFQALGLTRGQWLSIAMLVGVAVYTWFAMRKDTPLVGGWNAQASQKSTKK